VFGRACLKCGSAAHWPLRKTRTAANMQQADCSCHQGLTDLSCGAFVRQHRFLQAENPVTAAVASVTECQHGGSIIQLS